MTRATRKAVLAERKAILRLLGKFKNWGWHWSRTFHEQLLEDAKRRDAKEKKLKLK